MTDGPRHAFQTAADHPNPLRAAAATSRIVKSAGRIAAIGRRVTDAPSPSGPLPPLTHAQVAPALQDSRLADTALWAWRRVAATVDGSIAARACMRGVGTARAMPRDRVVGSVAWVVAVGAVVHLVMLLAVERYPFPRSTALGLPIGVLAAALTAYGARRPLARALDDRRDGAPRR